MEVTHNWKEAKPLQKSSRSCWSKSTSNIIIVVTVDIASLISRLKELIAKPQQEVLDSARILAGHGIKVALLKNNYKEKNGMG